MYLQVQSFISLLMKGKCKNNSVDLVVALQVSNDDVSDPQTPPVGQSGVKSHAG